MNSPKSELSSPCQACLHGRSEAEYQQAIQVRVEVGGQTVSDKPASRLTRQSDQTEPLQSTLPQQHSQVWLKRAENQSQELMQIIEGGGSVEIPMPSRYN